MIAFHTQTLFFLRGSIRKPYQWIENSVPFTVSLLNCSSNVLTGSVGANILTVYYIEHSKKSYKIQEEMYNYTLDRIRLCLCGS